MTMRLCGHHWPCDCPRHKPWLLDVFCGAGGCSVGYARAGFNVVGIDIARQPNYPYTFLAADALESLRGIIDGTGVAKVLPAFDAIHASPPCQSYSSLSGLTTSEYPRLIEPVRDLLSTTGLPYVIENVVGAPLIAPVKLCGSSFGLGVWRHRLFEMSGPPVMVPPCSHEQHPKPLDVTGTGGPSGRPRSSGGGLSRKPRNLAQAGEAMGIDWMSRRELAEAVPPAFTEWVGRHLLAEVQRRALERAA